MAHESFEDPAIAAQMNRDFVCIKVDREERPDLDAIYMQAVQALNNGQGGWPMTVFLTPAGSPFWGGTYFPPTDRRGMPGFPRVLTALADAWRTRREEVLAAGRELDTQLRQGLLAGQQSAGPLDAGLLDAAAHGLLAQVDPVNGGFGSAPKFPQPMAVEVLLRQWHRTGDEPARAAAIEALRAMAGGGIYDHLAGGFHRYSVDAQLADPALREDALRQRSAGPRLRARLPGDGRARLARGGERDARTTCCAIWPTRAAASTRPRTRTPRARRAGSTSGIEPS